MRMSGGFCALSTWSKLNSKSEITQSAVSGGKIELKKVTGSDSGVYQCSATNVLGNSQEVVRLAVNGELTFLVRFSLHNGVSIADLVCYSVSARSSFKLKNRQNICCVYVRFGFSIGNSYYSCSSKSSTKTRVPFS